MKIEIINKMKSVLKDIPSFREKSSENAMVTILLASGARYSDAVMMAKNYKKMASIDRIWRLVQHEHPELRGEDWQSRQRVAMETKLKVLGYKEVKE